jgi:hypothetical protein
MLPKRFGCQCNLESFRTDLCIRLSNTSNPRFTAC